MSELKNKEVVKESLIKIAKIIKETTNKVGGYGDGNLDKVMTSVWDGFNINNFSRTLWGIAEGDIIYTNKIGEIFDKTTGGYRKAKKETSLNKIGDIVQHPSVSVSMCKEDLFFSEIFKTEHLCNVHG